MGILSALGLVKDTADKGLDVIRYTGGTIDHQVRGIKGAADEIASKSWSFGIFKDS